MRPLNAVELQVLALLQAANGCLNLKQIGQKMPAITGRELGVALDTLTLRDLVERVDTGRDIAFAALAATAAAATAAAVVSAPHSAPAAAHSPAALHALERAKHVLSGLPAKPAVAPAPEPVNPASAAAINGKRVLAYLATAPATGSTGREIFEALALTQGAFSKAVRELEAQGRVTRSGCRGNAPLYALSPSAAATPAAAAAAVAQVTTASNPESTPGVTTPAVQPIDTATSTAAPAARPTHVAVTEPAGPRDGLSSFENAGAFEPAADELLAWHAQQAEAEAARRAAANATPLALPDAMRNTGEAIPCALGETVDLDVGTRVLVDTASFALWSDGRLEIDAGDDHVTLSQPATRALLAYLDRVCAIEQH